MKKSIAILSVGIAMLFFSCESDIQKVKEFSEMKEQPSLIADGFEVIYSDSTVIRYRMNTPKLIRHDEADPPYTEFPNGVHVERFDAKMNIIASIRADYAKQFIKEKRWEAKNNVVAVNSSGDTLKTEQLTWDEKKEKIYSTEFVRIIRADQDITGIGLEANQDFSEWEIKNIRGPVYVNVEDEE